MADGRMLKKLISTSRKLANLKTDSARLLYTWLLPHLDIQGRFSGEPEIIKGYIVPRIKTMTVEKIKTYIQDMVENKLIVVYRNNGDQYLELIKFKDFQTLREDRESSSLIPPPDESCITPGELPENSSLSKVKIREVKLREDKSKVTPFSEFDKKIAEIFIKRAESNFKTVKTDIDKYSKAIYDLRILDELTEETITEITKYLSIRPDVGKEFCWFDQIQTPMKLRIRSKRTEMRYWEMLLKEIERKKKTGFKLTPEKNPFEVSKEEQKIMDYYKKNH